MTPLNGFLEVGMYGDSAGLRLRGRCGRRGACVRTARCVRADGRMHGVKSAGKCVRESQEIPETAENKRKSPLRWNECSGLRGADGNRIHRRVANGYIRFVSSVFLNVYLFVSPKVDVALYVVARGICQMSSSVIHGKNVVYQCCSLIGFSVLGHNPPEILLNVEPHCDA